MVRHFAVSIRRDELKRALFAFIHVDLRLPSPSSWGLCQLNNVEGAVEWFCAVWLGFLLLGWDLRAKEMEISQMQEPDTSGPSQATVPSSWVHDASPLQCAEPPN